VLDLESIDAEENAGINREETTKRAVGTPNPDHTGKLQKHRSYTFQFGLLG
jgi:hypothetical protein